MEQFKTEKLIRTYLDCLDTQGYQVKVSKDNMGILFVVEIPKSNHKTIAILKGKMSQNLLLLKKMMRIVGHKENISPFLIIKLID